MARTIEAKTTHGQGLSLYSESGLSTPADESPGAMQQLPM
jgi:hypothetical protein